MEGLSIAANGLAVVSVAVQLSESCIRLYRFWKSVDGAPQEIAAINEDLKYLISIFQRIESNNFTYGECIAEGIQHCRIKILELTAIVERFDGGFQSLSRRKRRWAAFKVAIQSKHIQRFRESLSEAKSTLTLALVHQCIVQPQSHNYTVSMEIDVLKSSQYPSLTARAYPSTFPERSIEDESAVRHKRFAPSMHRGQRSLQHPPVSAIEVAKNVLPGFDKLVPEKAMDSLEIKELMLHAIGQTAIATFESDSLEIFAQDGYTMDASGALRSRTFVYSENLRYCVRHHASSYRTAFGCVWMRTTIIYLPNETGDTHGRSQSVTSFVFYPTGWIQQLGVRNGLEAVMASAGRSWLFNCRLTVTRAVPEDSLIFELCRTGQTRAVETLLSKGLGSVVDTSPKGWKPLHFAAAGGHVDLCAMLVELGADRTALVYEGPTTSILSPISIFVACAGEMHAEAKISMLRLFSDCIDIADSNGDGWTVHEWLKRTYAKEKVPISQNSITWLLHATANEEYVEFSARNVWSALQHAVRTVVCHERHSRFTERILDLSDDKHEAISWRHVESIGSLMALRVSGRVLLPMVVTAGSFLQIKGFDWDKDDMTRREYLQALPTIYSAWCHAVLDCVENLEHYMRLELEQYLRQHGWTRETLLEVISYQNTTAESGKEGFIGTACTDCQNNYGSLPCALVAPVQIAISECIRTDHDLDCACQKVYDSGSTRMTTELPEYTGVCLDDSDAEDSDTDEDFHDAVPYSFSDSFLPGQGSSDTFFSVAALLYRSQGRAWLGDYAIGEHLCATCFLHREHYTGKDGLIADFPPKPESFDGLRFEW